MKGDLRTYKAETAPASPLETGPEQARLPGGRLPDIRLPEIRLPDIQELQAENARLLRLIGELLVANQQLRERSAS